VTYSITGGDDAAKFAINASTGALTFVSAPNFEVKTDVGANNVYDVIVTASDGTLTDEQAIAVTVTNVNEAPSITSNGGLATAAISIAENTSAVTTVTSTDPDAVYTAQYTIAGGADASRFAINATTGALSFISAPNFEAPGDVGRDNVYNVIVRASDGALSTTQAIAVTVTDATDTIIGTLGPDILSGTNTVDIIQGLAGNDTLFGYGGNDMLDGGANNDTMVGGLGDDTYIVDATGDKITELANEGTDLVLTGIASYKLGDNVENLTFTYAGTSGGRAIGNAIANVFTGAAGADNLLGNDGNDTLYAMGGNDSLNGGAGNDLLDGGIGVDTMIGGLGDDRFIVDDTGDIVRESLDGGTDVVEASATFTLGNNLENLTLTGTAAINGTGNRIANLLTGNSGDNILLGAAGNDTLLGMDGNDTLNGGSGLDTLTGGLGADTFLFATTTTASLGSSADVVTDFSRTEGDKLAFSKAVFTGLGTVGTLDEPAFYLGTAAHDATDRIIYDAATGKLYYDRDGTGTGAQVLVATIGIEANPTLAFDDFLIMA